MAMRGNKNSSGSGHQPGGPHGRPPGKGSKTRRIQGLNKAAKNKNLPKTKRDVIKTQVKKITKKRREGGGLAQ